MASVVDCDKMFHLPVPAVKRFCVHTAAQERVIVEKPVIAPNAQETAAVFSKYPDIEARTPRETFTSKLRKLCAKLDSKNVATLTDKHLFSQQPIEGTVEVVRLWVVGSYARGALTCGDLDLVAEIRTQGRAPRPSLIAKAFFGTHANIRIYWGTPADNTSGAVFEEAVRLWASGYDWSVAILRIPIDLKAGRFSRPSDAVPLRAEQHTLPQEKVEEILKLRTAGVLKWRFIGISELLCLALELSHEEEKGYRIFCEQSVRKRQLAPLAFALARQLADVGVGKAQLQFSYSEKSLIRAAGVHVYVEQLTLRPESFDSFDCCALAFIPALTSRGPNGAWLIERGPNHPLVKAFSSVTSWTLAERDGTVTGIQFGATADEGWHFYVNGMELFASQEAAQEMENSLVCLDTQEQDEVDRLVPTLLNGEQVLSLLSGQDVLMFSDGEVLPLTREGLRYCRASGESSEEIASADQVVERLVRLAD